MSQEKPTEKKTSEIIDVFIITPIGANGSETYIKANGLIDSVINPVLNKMGMKGTAAHQIDASGSINNQIIDRIVNDKLVIANLTGLNPNVMYELAIRHAARKPVIMMADRGVTERLPFDIQDQRTIFYDDTLAGSVIARAELTKKLNAIDYNEKPDNPIYAAIKLNTILENVEAGDPTKILLEKIDSILSQLKVDKPAKLKTNLWLGQDERTNDLSSLTFDVTLESGLTDTQKESIVLNMMTIGGKYGYNASVITYKSGLLALSLKTEVAYQTAIIREYNWCS